MVVSRRNSYSVLAFNGSPSVASHIHQLKINNDMAAAITGNLRHQMNFVSKSYGGVQQASTKDPVVDDSSYRTGSISDDPDVSLTRPSSFELNLTDYASN